MTRELLRLDHVACCSSQRLHLFENISFALSSGSVLWVTGPAGCGKTTLLEVLIKKRRPSHGSVCFCGSPLWGNGSVSSADLRRQTGVIFQEDCLLLDRSVFDNVAIALKIAGSSGPVLHDRTYSALAEVGLTAKAKQPASQLASSERRMLAMARVLAKLPPLVIADLNTCDVDQKVIAPRLEALAPYGCGVLIFSKQHRANAAVEPQTSDVVLR